MEASEECSLDKGEQNLVDPTEISVPNKVINNG